MKKVLMFALSILWISSNAQITNGLVAHYPFSGDANDAQGSINGIISNVTPVSDRFGTPNAAYQFTKSNTPSSIDLGNSFNNVTSAASGSQFSLSIWFKRTDLNATMQLFQKHGTTWCNEIGHEYSIGVSALGELYFNYYDASSGSAASINGNYEISEVLVEDTMWHHYVVTYDGTLPSGQKRVQLYLDNAPQSSTLTNNGTNVTNIAALNAHVGVGHSLSSTGALCGNSNYGSEGIIDDIRLYNRIVATCDVRDLFVEGDMNQGLVAFYPFNGNADDSIGTVDGILSNVTSTMDRFMQPASAYRFTTTGTSSSIDLGDNFNDITTDGANFSVSIWFKRDNLSDGMQFLMKHGTTWCSEIKHQFAIGLGANGALYCNYYDASSGSASSIIGNYQKADTLVTDTAWHHFVVTYNGSIPAGQQRVHLYLDSLLIPSSLTNNGSDVVAIAMSTAHVGIGHSLSSTGTLCGNNNYGSDGMIDDVSIYNRILSDCDITDLYTPGTYSSTKHLLMDNTNMVLYPNPVGNELNIELDMTNFQNSTLDIISVTGQVVGRQTIQDNLTTINVSDLNKGIYFLRVETDKGSLSRKFIKS